MIFNKLFKGLVILSLCVASINLSSCTKDQNGNNHQGETPQPTECKPGDDFYTYANAEWLKSVEGTDQQKWHGFLYDIAEAGNAKVKVIMEEMQEIKMIKQGVANCEANLEASTQMVAELAQGLFADAENVYVAFGRAIRLGISSIATLHTGICHEDNTFGYFFVPPMPDEESVTGMHYTGTISHHVVSKRLRRYTKDTRSGNTTLDYILEGIGLDSQYYLYDEVSEQIAASLEEMPVAELAENLIEAVAMELLGYCSDEHASECTNGEINSVQKYVNKFIERDLGYFISYHFSNKYPTDSAEPVFSNLGDDLIASFRKRLENNQWLSSSTQQAAIEKLDYMGKYYGTPKKWPITDMLQLEGKILVADILDIKESRYNIIQSLLGKSVNEYFPIHYMFFSPIEALYSYTANAFYDATLNSFYVLPTYMMEPAYTADIDECKLYAIWGVTIGHEMTHGFDKGGATYDKNGVQNNWWTASDAAKFAELNARRAENVSNHEILPGMKAEGEKTVTEDVADLGGLNIAYDLWVNKLKERGVQGEALNEMKKQFFLNFAVLYSEKLPDKDMIARAEQDIHSAGHIRTNSVVQHIDDWYELFGVTEGDALYLAPEDRITIW